MAADDDLDALEAQLEGYDDDEDDDDLPPIMRIWKKFKFIIIPAAAFLIFIPVIMITFSGSDSDQPKILIVKELAPEPGKQIKIAPEQPGGAQVSGQDKTVYNMMTEGENKGQIAIVPPPEEPKKPSAESLAVTDGKNSVGSILPPPTPPEGEGVAVLPVLPVPGAPAPDAGKSAESILPVPPADAKVADAKAPDAKAPDVKAADAKQPGAVEIAPEPSTKVPATTPTNDNQIAVLIPKATPTPTTVAVSPPKSTSPGGASVTPMRTMAGVYRVQVASARSESDAKTLWDKQVNKNPDVLGKLPLTVQPAVIKDRGTFYRVQGGAFGDREAADTICRKLKSRGQDCIVVRP